jgi:hypothetical protein
MSCPCLSKKKKTMATLQSMLLFVIFASPMTFKLVQGILGKWVANPYGLPTGAGLVLHALLFGLVVYFLMHGAKNPFPKTTAAASKSMDSVTGY